MNAKYSFTASKVSTACMQPKSIPRIELYYLFVINLCSITSSEQTPQAFYKVDLILILLRWGETMFCGSGPLMGSLSIPQMIHEWIWGSSGMILTRENWNSLWKPLPMPLCTPQIPHRRTWASAVRSLRLTTAFLPGCCMIIKGLYYVKYVYVHVYSVAFKPIFDISWFNWLSGKI
jgi:hypothetical protein